MSAAAFCVSNFATTTAVSKSSKEATQRAISLYRLWQKSVPEIMRIHEINMPTSQVRAKIRENFEKNRYVEELPVRDILLARGHMEFQETINVWKQHNHIMSYFAAEEAVPKATTFLEKFYEGRS
ncbi:hypothetical protein CLU79DRAFT_748126 [Phycomyces nitens]|nr:hypothetical protein CLU79DRAFT_748126 [Phycomyces nitens]